MEIYKITEASEYIGVSIKRFSCIARTYKKMLEAGKLHRVSI